MTNIEKWLVDNGYQECYRDDEFFRANYKKNGCEVEIHFKEKYFDICHWCVHGFVLNETDAGYHREMVRVWDGLNDVKDPWEEAE